MAYHLKLPIKADKEWWKILRDYFDELSRKPPVFSSGDVKIIASPKFIDIQAPDRRKALAVLFGILEVTPVQADLKPYYGDIAKELYWGVSYEEYARQKARAERLERVLSLEREEKQLGVKHRERTQTFLKRKSSWDKYMSFIKRFLQW